MSGMIGAAVKNDAWLILIVQGLISVLAHVGASMATAPPCLPLLVSRIVLPARLSRGRPGGRNTCMSSAKTDSFGYTRESSQWRKNKQMTLVEPLDRTGDS